MSIVRTQLTFAYNPTLQTDVLIKPSSAPWTTKKTAAFSRCNQYRMHHYAASEFWQQYNALPLEVRARADKQFSLLKANPQHPSLQFKKVGSRHGQRYGRPV
jgi:hypothetical protein